MPTQLEDIKDGNRFKFGANWQRFLKNLNAHKISQAEKSLQKMLNLKTLENLSFLDVGSGSGLFSLAARRLGAKVFSFDYDPQSVACTIELKRRYFLQDNNWTICEGSVLDVDSLNKLGKFDIVYSWGVLHHSGKMWESLDNVDITVKDGGILFISIYNYQPFASKYWTFVKKTYNRMFLSRPLFIIIHFLYPTLPSIVLKMIRNRKPPRGMNVLTDLVDWLGGYPFEVATPKQIFDFYKNKNYELQEIKTVGGKHGCNEFVFRKKP